MNSLFGFGNPFLNAAKQQLNNVAQAPIQSATSTPNIFMQAIGAALRGESPQDFMQNLATYHPQLRQYDLSNLQATATQVCQQNGVNIQNTINQIDNAISPFINK